MSDTNSEKDIVNPARWRDEVLRRLRELTRRARNANLILLHEIEKDIYGDTIARCTDLLQSMNDPHFQAILDPANFIQCHPFEPGRFAIIDDNHNCT